MDVAFTVLGWVPGHDADVRAHITHLSLDYTFWMNLLFGVPTAYLFTISRKNTMRHDRAGHEHGNETGGTGARHDHAAHHSG